MARTKAEEFVAALVSPIQVLEDTLQQVLIGRTLDGSVGVQLTTIGKVVGAKRDGITDDEIFRRIVRATIAANKSDGTIEDLIKVSDLVVYDDDAVYRVQRVGVAAVRVLVEGVLVDWSVAEILIKLLRKAKGGGIWIFLEFTTVDPADTFAFDGGPDGLGWGDTLDAGTGGAMASALE